MNSIEAIRKAYLRYAAEWEITPVLHEVAQHDGATHVEFDGARWAYLGTDRGTETLRKETSDPDELLYWLLSHLAFGMAVEFELRHRVPGQDFRRILFAKQLELLAQLDRLDWHARLQNEIDEILQKHPYRDID